MEKRRKGYRIVRIHYNLILLYHLNTILPTMILLHWWKVNDFEQIW
jgi:hypothetical protein